ncbi:LOW QUALITY PROTEIN: hypothetical protein HID58_092917 [Brassica napus]|uniref:Oberon coiled-coil region domain-containing protein n=1 Tax=Brassica napus TaxID=3708 RepID=A0ABQ7X6U2_BRANA|nr:LOW QUALITY PROTEIN: hypothetical protein HID58_094562 [Brassica napus]KAH0853753.1 LOW QUALITY PROTEIN: hypothetical protein HID58_092917 [Brassica napus]
MDRSSIFAHGVQEIIQMDLKTSKMILPDKHMRAISVCLNWQLTEPFMSPAYCPWHSWISGAQQYAPNCDRESWIKFNPFHYHVSKVIDLDAAKSFENGEGCLQAATIQPSIFARKYRLMARTGKHSNLGNSWLWMNPLRSCDTTSKSFSTASVTILGEKKAQSTWLSGVYTWLSRLHNRELEDKAKEVPELKTERHKKKLNIDEVEGIARLNLAEAAILKLTKHNGSLRVTSEQRLAKAEAEKQYMFEKINLTENSSSHHKVVVVEETRHMCDVLKDL